MIKKIFFVFAFALMSQLIVACINCNCAPAKTIYFTNKGLSLKNLDLSLSQSMVTNSSIISSANYGIELQWQTTLLVKAKQKLNLGLMQSAYACKCNSDDFIGKENISALKIVSNQDFDIDHPKNSDLSLYFKARKGVTMITIADYLKLANDLKNTGMYTLSEGIFLQVAPKLSKKHQFKLIVTLSDGRILEAETTEVELT